MNVFETAYAPELAQDKTPSPALYHLPSTEQLLVEGGDARIALNPDTGCNKYNCRPHPDANIAAFGSATATTISATAFFAAEQLRNRLAQHLTTETAASVYADEMQRIRHELIELCGLANYPGLDVVFAASGTDVHLIAAQLSAAAAPAPVRILSVDPAETGSGVPAALAGQHFSSRSALGAAVMQNSMLEKSSRHAVATIPIRRADGIPRPGADIDADFEQQVVAATAAGQRVLLTMVDVSKTGMIAPGGTCAAELHRRFAGSLDVLVDACQFRIAPATLKAYLEQGFMVAITGSKFISGPSFSGALLIPEVLSKKLRHAAVADQLQAYSTRADWPANWGLAHRLPATANFGLLLRWEGALKELRAFRSVSHAAIAHFLHTFAEAAKLHLASNPVFELLPVPELQRTPLTPATPSDSEFFAGAASSGNAICTQGWDHIQTIFPFLLFHPAGANGKIPLNNAEVAQIYLALQDDSRENERVQLAQPVACGTRGGTDVSALRLCVSSRLVVEAMQHNGRDEQLVIQRALHALDKVAQLVHLL